MTMDDTVIVHPTQLAPRCARSSLKRARLLFNDSSSAVLPPSSDASPSNSIRDVISSYIPPMYDRDGSINRTNISRRVELAYNTDVDSLAFRNFYPSSGEGGTSTRSNSKKETATVRALREISDMASERIRSGLGPVVAEDEDGSNGGENEGRLVLHRDGNRPGGALVSTTTSSGSNNVRSSSAPLQPGTQRPVGGGILIPRDGSSSGGNINIPTPKWHAPWKLSTVISSHLGWVRSVAFDPTNVLFATGGADRVIKIFDLAKSCIAAEDALRITLTGHISPVRGLAFSERHPYLFSAGEDKLIKCWDLETNQVIRHYHGHLSGIFALKLHPTLDLLVTGGRDAVARVWDMRTKHQVHCLTGHDNTVGALLTKGTDPQIITGSYDSTIKLWDLAAGKCMTTLTHHKKSVRALARPNYENTFISGAADTLKKWVGTDGRFVKNFTGHGAVINALAINDDGVVLSGADDGTMNFWDYSTGHCFQTSQTVAQPGSLDAENGIFAAEFDLTGTRLITCEADKTIKIWKEDDRASEMSHPIDMKSWRKKCIAESKRRY